MTKVESADGVNPRQAFRVLILGNGHSDEICAGCLQEGHEVVSVKTSQEALDFLKSHDHVDAAVAPAFMDGETVFDFLLGLRGMPENESVRIMILSTEPSQLAQFCTPAVESAAKKLGAYKFITVPVFRLTDVMKELTAILPDVPSKLIRQ